MHRSKLSAILIDCDERTIGAGTRFWSQALGMPEVRSTDPGSTYINLQGSVDSISVGMQRIGSASRVHLDIESDEVEAEVRRLEGLGAHRKEFIETWWVMEDPAGMLFCVVPQGGEDSLDHANVWDG